jgi:hypothetical protein
VCGSPDYGFFLFDMNERSYLILDLVRSNILDLNPTESILASCLFGLLAQNPIQYAGKPYYMADYKNVSVYCPILPNKVDTLRRLYKNLENLGLIELIKIDNHVCFTPSQMLRDWGTVYKSVEAEKNPVEAEKNPVEAEKNPVEAEKNPVEAEKNPPYINIINNNINNNDNNIAPQIDFAAPVPVIEQPEESKDKKTLFRNSEIYKLVKFDETGAVVDYSEFEKKFATPEFETVDLVYYFHAVADWSDQKNMKRTKNGWLATVRNFIRGDVERNKLHLKPQFQQSKSKINVSDAVSFLNKDSTLFE